MKKFDKVLLASDFDGTLKDDNGVITKDVLDAVRYFQENGGFYHACHRQNISGTSALRQFRLQRSALFANGALAYDFKSSAPAFFDGIGEEGREVVSSPA